MELEQRIQVLQSKNDTLQDTLEALQNSHKDLEKELESTEMQKTSFVEKVSGPCCCEGGKPPRGVFPSGWCLQVGPSER